MRSYTYREGGARIEFQFTVNGKDSVVNESADTPLLYVLTNDLRLQGPRFGCGLGQCGGCSVLVNDVERRSCLLPVSAVQGKRVTTLEGILNWYASKRAHKPDLKLHPVQQAMLDEQAVQCGYCYNGMVIKSVELLSKNSHPSDADIRSAMRGHLCRCGTYPRILKAIQRAAAVMAKDSE